MGWSQAGRERSAANRRKRNRKHIIETLHAQPGLNRAQLQRATGMCWRTVHEHIEDLLVDEAVRQSRGYPVRIWLNEWVK
jgi:hypothetical protein